MQRETLTKTVRFFMSFVILIILIGNHYNTYASTLLQNELQKDTQSYTEYKGIVIDSNTKEPLPFADLTVNTTNIRTVTNKEGEFLLKVPNNLLDKMLTISYLGYETEKILLQVARHFEVCIVVIETGADKLTLHGNQQGSIQCHGI